MEKRRTRSATGTIGFFAITFAVTWTFWVLAAAVIGAGDAAGSTPAALRELLFLPGTIAPAMVALALTARAGGPEAIHALLSRILRWRVPVRWYVFAAGYFAAVELAAALVYRAVDGDWPRFGSGVWYVMLAAIVVSMWVQAGEELGWRGYALPRLAAQWGLGRAGVLLGVVWAFWHLPLFFIPGTSTSGQSFPVYLLQVTALSVAMTFLYWRTRGSLLLVMLMHASVNNTAGIVQSSVVDATQVFGLSSSLMAWSTAAVMWIAALYFLIRMRGMPLLGSDEAMRTTHRRTAQSMAAEPNQRS